MAHKLLPLEAISRGLPLDLVGINVENAGPGGIVRVDWSGGERNRPLALYRFCSCMRCKKNLQYLPIRGLLGPWGAWPARTICYVSASDSDGNGFSIIFTDRSEAKWLVMRYLRVSRLPRPRLTKDHCDWDGRPQRSHSLNYERGNVAHVTLGDSLRQILPERGVWGGHEFLDSIDRTTPRNDPGSWNRCSAEPVGPILEAECMGRHALSEGTDENRNQCGRIVK